MKSYLKLYITSQTPKSQLAIRTLHQVCCDRFKEAYEIEIIDVPENLQLAEEEKNFATPTVIKALRPPIRRVIGDVSEKEKVLLALDLASHTSSRSFM